MFSLAIQINWRDFAEDLDSDVRTALVRSINRVADRTRTRVAREVRDQVNFPASYLSPSEGKLVVTGRARSDELEARISGRDRATSLARFTNQKIGGRRGKGVAVSVAAGGRKKTIERAFLMNLKNGNTGLAVRTNGGPPAGAWKPREIAKNLYLLYGPSVDQTLLSATGDDGVFEDVTPETLELLEYEFSRQLDLLRSQRNA